jgi:MFS family permease
MLLGTLGGASVIGRLAIGMIAPRVDLVSMYRASFVAITASLLLWLTSDGQIAALWAFAIIFGIAYGAWVAMLPSIAAHLFGLERLGVTLGVVFTAGGFGALIGVPLAGGLTDAGGYDAAIAMAFAVAATASVVVWPLGRPEVIVGPAAPAAT